MIDNFQNAQQHLFNQLAQHNLEITSTATRPLRSIDFSKLVQIHDHEERFLLEVFLTSLLNAHRARVSSSKGTKKINAHDVQTAMLMLGSAVASAAEEAFTQKNKSLIQVICPYCA